MAVASLDRGRRRLVATALAAAALLLAACGDTLQTAAEQLEDLPEFVEPEVVDEPPEAATDQDDREGDGDGDDPDQLDQGSAQDADDPDDRDDLDADQDRADAAEQESGADPQAPAGDDPAAGSDRCALTTAPQAQVRSEADYLAVLGEVNLGLEEVVVDLDAALAELETGVSDGPSLAAELEALLGRYQQVTSEVPQLAPLAGAEGWHADAIGRFEAVCLAMLDGWVGIEDGDDERFAAFVAALREFPTLANELHATMMVGPFEAG